MTDPLAHAQAVAEHAAGGSPERFRAMLLEAQIGLDTYYASLHAALLTAAAAGAIAPPLLTAKAVCARLGVCRSTLNELIATGRLKKVANLGASVRITEAEVARFIANKEES